MRRINKLTALFIISLMLTCCGTAAAGKTGEKNLVAYVMEQKEQRDKLPHIKLTAAVSTTEIREKSYVCVTGTEVRFREEPSLNAKILLVLQYGQELDFINEVDGWGFVELNGVKGYVYMQYLERLNRKPTEGNEKSGKIIAIDAGHQKKANNDYEPIGPGAVETKSKVAAGTSGVSSKVPEYRLTLDVSLKLKKELEQRGYEVYMIRETDDVNISNRERAEMAFNAEADVLIRIHANGSDNYGVKGILTISPTAKNPYVPEIYNASRYLSDCVLKKITESTGAKNRGVWETDSMSGINWSLIPVTIVEMGFMTNPEEDMLMQTEVYQNKLANGIADGIDLYFLQ